VTPATLDPLEFRVARLVVSCRIQQKQSVQVGPLCNLAGRLSFVKVGRHLRGDFVFFVLLLCCV
jgi:hypothetical protein